MTSTAKPSLTDLLDAIAGSVPEREAVVVQGGVRRSYASLRDRAARFGVFLAERGLGVHPSPASTVTDSGQDHVALLLHNSVEYIETFFGALRARLAPFNVNYRYTPSELAALFTDARPAVVVFHARFAGVLKAALKIAQLRPLLVQVDDGSETALMPGARHYERILALASPAPSHFTSPDDLVLVFTGGTTGAPKGVLWRQHDMWVAAAGGSRDMNARSVSAAAATVPGPRFLAVAPFMHGAGLWYMIRVLMQGGTVFLPANSVRFDPAQACALIESEQLDTIVLVGEAFAHVFAEEVGRVQYGLSSMRLIACGGGITSPRTKARLTAAMPAAKFMDSAGSSETGGILRSIHSQRGLPEAAIFDMTPRSCVVADRMDRLLEADEMREGWLAAREPIALGYLRDPEKSVETFRTVSGERVALIGDRVRSLGNGRVELLGRAATVINTGGEKVFAEEVERALLEVPGVADVLVVGRPSVRWGHEVVALVQRSRNVTDSALLDRLQETLASYKTPKQFVTVPEIRRSPAGKPDYAWARSVAIRAKEGTPT